MYMPVCWYPQRPEEGIRSLGAGGPRSCGFSSLGAGNQTPFSAGAMSVPDYWAISLATPPFIPVLIANINPQGI